MEARLDRLEKSLKGWKALVVLQIAVFCAVCLLGWQTPKPGTVDAMAFRLVDTKGTVHGIYGTTGDFDYFSLGADGSPQIAMASTRANADLEMNDATGKRRAAMRVSKTAAGSVAVFDREGRPGCTLYYADPSGDPKTQGARLIFCAPDGTITKTLHGAP